MNDYVSAYYGILPNVLTYVGWRLAYCRGTRATIAFKIAYIVNILFMLSTWSGYLDILTGYWLPRLMGRT